MSIYYNLKTNKLYIGVHYLPRLKRGKEYFVFFLLDEKKQIKFLDKNYLNGYEYIGEL